MRYGNLAQGISIRAISKLTSFSCNEPGMGWGGVDNRPKQTYTCHTPYHGLGQGLQMV